MNRPALGANPPSRNSILLLCGLVAIVLVWRILTTGVAALNERSFVDGQQAARLPLGSPDADGPWRQRLSMNPADAKAMLVLALELEKQGKRTQSADAMDEALRLAPGDLMTLLRGVGYFLRAGDDARALATLRHAVEISPGEVDAKVWRVFTLAIDTGQHRPFFEQIARENPAWWPGFFQLACASGNVGAVQALFETRAKAGVATLDERRCLIDRLQREGQWTSAYVLWLNGLPVDQRQRVGYVFNGGFESPLSNFGFDWRMPAQDGIDVGTEATDGTNGKRALNLTFGNKRFAGSPIYQYLTLSPGRYQFEGRGRSDLETWLGLQWGLYCEDSNGRDSRQLAHSVRFSGAVDWTDFRQPVVVPADCPAQILRLELANPKRDATTPGNVVVRLKGRVWFDDIRIRFVD